MNNLRENRFTISTGVFGFTLIEALMAGVIVAIGIIPIFDMISQANKSLSSVEEETVAFGLASEATEWLKSQNYTALEYPEQLLKVFAEGCLTKSSEGYVECVEEPVKSFQPPSPSKDASNFVINYEPAKQFEIYTRSSRIYLPEKGAIKVEVTVTWLSRLDISKTRQKSEVKLQFMRFM